MINNELSIMRTSTYSALATLIKEGKLFVPDFQRSYVWSFKDVLNLFDSLLRGFPIGGQVIIWDTGELGRDVLSSKRDQVKGFTLPTNTRKRRMSYILDGQQRVLTYLYVVHREFFRETTRTRFDVAALIDWDENEYKFERTCSYDKKDPYQYLIRDIVDCYKAVERFKALNEHASPADIDEFKNFVQAMATRIGAAEAAVTTVETEDIATAAKIFEKINLSGRSLTETDILHAMFRSQAVLFSDQVDRFIRALTDTNFLVNPIKNPEKMAAKCIAVSSGYSNGLADRKDMFSSMNQVVINDKAGAVSEHATHCVSAAIKFLQESICGDMTADYLPINTQLVMLTHFFHCLFENYGHFNASKKQKEVLAQWFWKSSFGQRYSGINARNLKIDADSIKKLAANGISDLCNFSIDVDRIREQFISATPLQSGEKDSFQTAVRLFMLKAKGMAGEAVATCEADFLLPESGSEPKSIVNMVILSEKEIEFKKDNGMIVFFSAAEKDSQDFRAQNLLPEKFTNYKEFLSARTTMLIESIMTLLDTGEKLKKAA
jgi:hypothetical protein